MYDRIRASTGHAHPGYMVHEALTTARRTCPNPNRGWEAGRYSATLPGLLPLPRTASVEPYHEERDLTQVRQPTLRATNPTALNSTTGPGVGSHGERPRWPVA